MLKPIPFNTLRKPVLDRFNALPPTRTGPQRRKRRWGVLVAISAMVLVGMGGGCASLPYYWQAVGGHLEVMRAAKPIEDWLQDQETSPALKHQLALAQSIRRFAVSELHLPDNASYQRYADLGRRSVVWNVVGAAEFSLDLYQWCTAVVGCVGYRGYYTELQARSEASVLGEQGLEVSVYGVPAYSTLGWLNWAGGDPLLNTFIYYPAGELARMIFHELAHQVVFVSNDTVFNESFASAVERLGGEQWLQRQGSLAQAQAYAEFDSRRQQFRLLCLRTRSALSMAYQGNGVTQTAAGERAALKQQIMAEFRAHYATLREGWGGYSGYDAWVANANNANFATQGAYDDLVPGFVALFAREGRVWPRFYDAVRRLAKLSPQERSQFLHHLATENLSG